MLYVYSIVTKIHSVIRISDLGVVKLVNEFFLQIEDGETSLYIQWHKKDKISKELMIYCIFGNATYKFCEGQPHSVC